MNRSTTVFFCAIFFITFCFPLFSLKSTKIYNASRLENEPPVIDGNLEENAWTGIDWAAGFSQKMPYEGIEPTQKTAFKVLYDNRHIYVGIRAFDNEPGKIEKRMTRRDERQGDWVEIILDSYNDRRTGFSFSVNAAGVKSDVLISGDGDDWDGSWDAIWDAQIALDDKGWTAEIRIPLTQLRFGDRDDHQWGLHVARFVHRLQELSEWNLIPRNSNGFVSWFGQLHGLKEIKHKRPIELLPYTVGKMERFKEEEGNPFATGKLSNLTGGLDGKIGVTSDLTLDFTINPDFGQVEADPSEVNLSAFETFFQEKRPFFIEGRSILDYQVCSTEGDFSRDNLFYSRRIGRSPQHSPDTGDDEYLDMPNNTTILGAFKLTGKTRNGLSIGILDSVTGKETAEIASGDNRRYETAEPLTNYFALRVQKDLNNGSTAFGGMFTSTHRDLNNSPNINYLRQSAYSGGVDFYHSWKNKEWEIYAKAVFSHVTGSKEAIRDTQESSVRYFQRPDADHLDYDPNRTSLTGHGGDISIGKTGGGTIHFRTGFIWRSPGLELNDVGYLRSADKTQHWAWMGYRSKERFGIFNNLRANLSFWHRWNFGGELLERGLSFNTNMTFTNYWGVTIGGNLFDNILEPTSLRGGPSLLIPGRWNYWLFFHTDNRRKLVFRLGHSQLWGDYKGRYRFRVWGRISYRPLDSLSLSIRPQYTDLKEELQYVDTIELNNSTGKLALDDNRFIFAKIRQKTFDVQIRLNYSITPDLSIQFYGQPFISVGKYSDYKYITNPRAEKYTDRFHKYTGNEIQCDPDSGCVLFNEENGSSYDLDNPNFRFLQFRSNLVLRWEYRPGSTLYVVWSQGRTDSFDTDIEFSPGRNLSQLFQIPAHNIFLVKFTYRLKI